MARNRSAANRGRFNSSRIPKRLKRQSLAVEEFNSRERQAESEVFFARTTYRRLVLAAVLSVRFNATFPLDGFRDWYVISGIPVQMSRHTCMGRSMTRVVMDHIGYLPGAPSDDCQRYL